jgi:hypothetical protein
MLLYITAGIFIGLIISSVMAPQKPQHINAEYFIELKSDDSAIIEGLDGHTYRCHINSIPVVLTKDNL